MFVENARDIRSHIVVRSRVGGHNFNPPMSFGKNPQYDFDTQLDTSLLVVNLPLTLRNHLPPYHGNRCNYCSD